MHPDLMGAPGIDLDFDQRELAVGGIDPAKYMVVRKRVPSAGMARCHADAANTVTTNGGGDRARVFLHPAVNQGNVFLLYFALGKLLSEFAMRFVILGDDNQPAGFLVETMDDAGAHLSANGREAREMMQ